LSRRGSSYYGLVSWAYQQAEVMPQVVMHLDSVEAIKRMVLDGFGVAFLPRGYIEEDLRRGTLVRVRLRLEPAVKLEQRIVILYRKDKAIDGAMQAFVEAARSVFPPPAVRGHP
jgi:DNA-binding transcriptional LysR family regulator